MEPGTIFFSYSRKDAESFAFKLASDLRAAGARVWIDQLDIPPGRNWDEEIEKALNASKYILFIASEKSVTSQNVLNEIYYAVDENKTVVPIKIHNCTIPFRIRRFQYIDFTGNYDAAFNRLVKYLEANNEEFKVESIPTTEKTKPFITGQTPGDRSKISEMSENPQETPKSRLTEADQHTRDPIVTTQNRKAPRRYLLPVAVVLIVALGIAGYLIFFSNDRAKSLSDAVASNDSVAIPVDSNQNLIDDTVVASSDANGSFVSDAITGSEKTLPNGDVDAHYRGGRAAWLKYINSTLTYPKQARDEKIEGTVMVRFVVDTSGNIREATAVGGPMGGGLRKEAVRIVEKSSPWIPAARNGRKVRVLRKVGIAFKLD